MGRAARPKPKRLGEKLLQIRLALGLSQNELIKRFGLEDFVTQNRISTYEIGTHEPPLIVLLPYARAAGVYVDDLIDDELDLPARLPGNVRHEGIKSHHAFRKKSKR